MIFEFNQIDRQPNPLFEGMKNKELVITGKGATRKNNAYVIYGDKKIEILSNPHREKINGKSVTQVMDIFCAGKRVGYIYPDLVAKKKILFISWGYEYINFHFDGTDYMVYEVGLGVEQHYICVYKDDETVAIIKKHDIKIDYCDRYTIYALDEELLLSMAVLTLGFDCVKYPDHGAVTDSTRMDDSCLTLQKELNEKYDPSFIDKVIENESIS